MTRRTSRRRSSRRLRPNKGFDTVYYWNGKWRAAAPLPPPLGRGETLGEMKAAVERMGYVAVLGSVARGAPKTPPWRLQQNGEWRQEGLRRRSSLRRNSRRLPAGMKSWQGIDALERRENLIHNRLVGVILDDIGKGTLTRSRAEEYIHEAEAFVANLEAQHPPGGARGHAGKWKAHTLDKLRGYLVRAKKQLEMVANAGGCPYCVSPPGRHKWWCKKLAKNSRKHTSRRR
jgi:hypothetical protein